MANIRSKCSETHTALGITVLFSQSFTKAPVCSGLEIKPKRQTKSVLHRQEPESPAAEASGPSRRGSGQATIPGGQRSSARETSRSWLKSREQVTEQRGDIGKQRHGRISATSVPTNSVLHAERPTLFSPIFHETQMAKILSVFRR